MAKDRSTTCPGRYVSAQRAVSIRVNGVLWAPFWGVYGSGGGTEREPDTWESTRRAILSRVMDYGWRLPAPPPSARSNEFASEGTCACASPSSCTREKTIERVPCAAETAGAMASDNDAVGERMRSLQRTFEMLTRTPWARLSVEHFASRVPSLFRSRLKRQVRENDQLLSGDISA